MYGAARAIQKVGTPETACVAVERFKLFIGMPDAEPEEREKAANGLGDLIAQCNEKMANPTVAPTPAIVDATATKTGDKPVVDCTWAWRGVARQVHLPAHSYSRQAAWFGRVRSEGGGGACGSRPLLYRLGVAISEGI